MRNIKSYIAKFLLLGYFITLAIPALSAGNRGYVGAGENKRVCKKSHILPQKPILLSLQAYFSPTQKGMEKEAGTAIFSLCDSSGTYLPPRSENEFPIIVQQEKVYPATKFTSFTIVFQELDPDPPKHTLC